MRFKLHVLTEQHLEFLSLKGGCTDSFESTLVKIHCMESHAMAHMYLFACIVLFYLYAHVLFRFIFFVRMHCFACFYLTN